VEIITNAYTFNSTFFHFFFLNKLRAAGVKMGWALLRSCISATHIG
jgi:hypothetical protein